MKKILLAGLCASVLAVPFLWRHHAVVSREVLPAMDNPLTTPVAAATNLPPALAAATPVNNVSREMDLTVNPYAAGLREPGKSKREWNAAFIETFQQSKSGDPAGFELTGGVMAQGVVKIVQVSDGKVSYVSGELTAPEAGKFFFLAPPVGGKAGKAVGIVEFTASKIAYRIEPTGPNGDPELWQRRLDEVLCTDMPKAAPALLQQASAQLVTNEPDNLIPVRPDQAVNYIPSYNANIVSLQSYPGSPAVLLLDFAGGYTASWGGVNYTRPPVGNGTIKDIWKRIAEDYMPFNINVTTDIKVFLAAPAASRQRCCFTTTPITAAGVAYFGSWNWGNDTVCWSVYYVGKPAGEVGAHEPGHTLGLAHQGQNPGVEYYGGQGSGEVGWAPIMGVGYYQPLATFAKGEYLNANQQQDELQVITTANNNVTYRTDDTGSTLATSRYLEVYTNNTTFAEGVIERTDDTDAFQFTTSGGVISLTVKPVAAGDWANLATLATLADATDTVIASNNVQNSVSSTIATNLPAGTYTFRVTGAGKNDVLSDGFTSYASLGYYAVTGSIAGARMPTRLSVVDHATNNTVVGPVVSINPNSSPLVYAITSGNTGATFSVDNSGVVRVANNTLVDYYKLATNSSLYAAQFEVFMNITNVNNPAFTELNRRVVIAVQKLYPPVPALLTANIDTSLRIDLAWMGSQEASSYNVKRSTTHLGPYATIANLTDTSYTDSGLTNGVTYYYVVSALNTNGESANSAEASAVAQAVANFGFEYPSIGANYQYNAKGAFWTFNGTGGNGSGILGNGSGFGNPNSPEGTQAAFVQSFGSMSQTLSGFTPGISYTVTYSAAQRSGASQHGGESWNVVIDNSVIKTNSPGATSYTTYTATFTATNTTHTLSFIGTDLAGGDNTVFIDNVRFISPSLKPVPAAVAIASPANNAAIEAAAPVNLTATVTTNGNIINGVQFYTDNITLLGQITNAPYIFAWANVSGGKHTVFARVLFNNGSSADSIPISFTVLTRNQNLGFETPSLGSGNFAYSPDGASWTFTDGSSGNGSGISANASGFGNPAAPQGTQAALVQSYGSISQVLSGFSPGTNYTITYSAAQRSGAAQNGGESWNVVIDNAVIKTNVPGSTSYTTYTANFTAIATTHTLSFVGTDLAGGDNTVFIDNISFNPPLTPSPLPTVTTNALPATAVDVVGNQITFMAGFSSTNPLSYQWQKIVGGLQTDISGATNTSLTLNNLQLNDTASYRLQASNALGIAVSTASPLTISSVPGPVTNNVIITYAAQTGLGSALTNFTPTWPFATGSLISGQLPSSVGSGNFSQSTALLTEGSFGYFNFIPGVGLSPTEVIGGSSAGQSVTYTLSSAPSGYNITNIVVYGGWGDAGRDQQAYTVSYSTVADPSTFITLASVDFNPVNPSAIQSATRSSLKSSNVAPLATNVAALKFDFTTPSPENGYVGYSEIAVYGASIEPAVIVNTLPVTAADVVGSQVTFSASITGASPLAYQWKRISGGVTNNVAGATNALLTLSNLQLTNTASYLLQASNAFGVALSSPSSLTVNSAPGAVNNVNAAYAAQTGLGGNTFFAPTWSVPSSNSLIVGVAPSSSAGNFSLNTAGRTVNSLTAGDSLAIGPTSASDTTINYITCGNSGGAGTTVTYTLSGFAAGYTLTNITVFGGWKDAGRDQQAYTVSYSKVTAPASFISLGTVNYNPANPAGAQSATRATLTAAVGALATNVAAVKFDFTTPVSENGYVGYAEILLLGTPSPQPVKWAVGNGNWDTSTFNWKSLVTAAATTYLENNLTVLDDSATGSSPLILTLTGNHSPSTLTNNSTKNYILTGGFSVTNGSLIKNGSGTLILDNGLANNFSGIQINSGTLQLGNNDANGSLGTGNVTNNATLIFNRTDTFTNINVFSGTGSLIQNGSGTVVLSASNTYSGNTTITSGTLALSGSGAVTASAQLALALGANLDISGRSDQTLTLASGKALKGSGTVLGNLNALANSSINPGDNIGTLTVFSNVAVNGLLLMELNRTNVQNSDQIVSITGTITTTGILTVTNLGPTLSAGDTFQLFSQPISGFAAINLPDVSPNAWVNHLATNGIIRVVATTSTNLVTQVIGSNLGLSWPADHIGWRLQVQTNDITQGLGTNWVDVSGATLTNQVTIPFNLTSGSVFYRLSYP